MSRRVFLKSLLGARAPTRRCVLIQESPVAGFQYHAGGTVWGAMREGDALTLAREPQNPYDERAVRVDWRRQKLSYVPRVENSAVAQMLDRGEPLAAYIERLKDDADPWERVRLAVDLDV